MKDTDTVWSISVEEVQSMALAEIGRKLTDAELVQVSDAITEAYLAWPAVVVNAIVKTVK